MKIQITICDGCDRRFDGDDETHVYSFRINRGKDMDPSGNGYNTSWEYIDLCQPCLKVAQAKEPDVKFEYIG